ncbi:MAG TPA: hypothetical protein VIS94_17000 [Desulfomonilia bacterium]
MKLFKENCSVLTAILFITILSCPATAFSTPYDIDPPFQSNTPEWQAFRQQWDKHWDGKNIDQLISLLKGIEKTDPNNVSLNLWFSRVYCLKGKRSSGKIRSESFNNAVTYAAKARGLDKDNVLAVRLLIDAASNIDSSASIMSRYGNWIKDISPQPYIESLDPISSMPGWDNFAKLWASRYDIDKATQAQKMMEDWASSNPDNGAVQIWAIRTCSYMGDYFTNVGDSKKGLTYYKKGITYGERANKLIPNSLPAKYWYNACLGRSVQHASLIKKASHFSTFFELVLFFWRENSQYNNFGFAITMAPMITNGGWVTEKGMNAAGVTAENVLTSLDIAAIVYPDVIQIPYSKALLLEYKGRKGEAIKVLENLITKNPDKGGPSIMAENRINMKEAKELYENLLKGK